MYEELLTDCGLTKNESLIYLALLKLGKAKSGDLVREARVSGGKIYETLYKLIDKGLIKEYSENGIKNFEANNPSSLLEYIDEKRKNLETKEKSLKKILPSLTNIQASNSDSSTFFFKGIRGIKSNVYSALQNAESIKIMGISSSKDEKFNNFWRNWHTERVSLKKEAKMIFSDRNTEYWKFFKNIKFTQMKELNHLSPSAIMIIDEQVFIFSYENDFSCVNIKSVPISISFSNFFDDLWRIAKK
jgi:sugar-specific transcriptional regulator TrmB